MLSTTINRSVAALGVVAGLLAAAVPASAQLPPTTNGYTPPVGSNKGNLATDPSSEVDNQMKGISAKELADAAKAPASSNQVFTSVSNVFKGEVIGLEPNALGTQVGSEGMMAPAKTLPTGTDGNNNSNDGTSAARPSTSSLS